MARNSTNSSVLIARFSAIGDVAMTIPVIYSVCRAYPDVRFVMLTRRGMAGMFLNIPDNLVVEGIDLESRIYKGIAGMQCITAEMIQKYNIDTFVDLHDVLRTRLISFFCRLRNIRVARIDKGRNEKKSVTRKRNKQLRQLKPQTERYSEAFARAGLMADTSSFTGIFGGKGLASTSLLSSITPPKKPRTRWVAIAPFAAHPSKIYPPERMHQVVDVLARRPDIRIFLLGAAGKEQEILDGWAATYDNVTSLAGKRHGFSSELALLNHCDAALTMDSANMHLAALAGTPTAVIWGATHPYTGFGGWCQNESNYIQLPMPCRPCSTFGNKSCTRGDYHCLAAIRPSIIVEKILSLISE